MKESDFTKETLRSAIGEITGKSYNLGPYKPERYEIKNEASEALGRMLENAKKLGIEVKQQ